MGNISGDSTQFNGSSLPGDIPSEGNDFFDVAGLKTNDLNALNLSQLAIQALKVTEDHPKGNKVSENLRDGQKGRDRLKSLEKLKNKLERSQAHYAQETAGLKGFFKRLGHFFRGTLSTRKKEKILKIF